MVGERIIETSGDIASVVEWLHRLVPCADIPANASWLELHSLLKDGSILCLLLEALCPGFGILKRNSMASMSNLEKFSVAIDEMGLPRLDLDDLQQGCKEPVLLWLGNLKAAFKHNANEKFDSQNIWNGYCSENGIKSATDNDNSHGVADGNVTEISSTNLDNASTRALFELINNILDKEIGRKNAHMYDTPCVVKKLVQFLGHRVSTQAEIIKDHNNTWRNQSDQYQATLRAFESLVGGTAEEIEVLLSRLERIKIEKSYLEENYKVQEQRLRSVKEELLSTNIENSTLREELENLRRHNENYCEQLKKDAEETNGQWERKFKILESTLSNSQIKVKELESCTESRAKRWKKKESTYKRMIEFQIRSLQEVRSSSESIKQELLKTRQNYAQDFTCLGKKFKSLAYAAENYHSVLAENRSLYNEVQDLKGSIRVYCRVRPFLSGEGGKQTTIEYLGENGELIVSNPSKQGKDGRRVFQFDKVFSPMSTQEEVFLDTRPLIRSILDGYNVCIFAYGQTGSGKTYTMSGPSVSSKESWGVNIRALYDLFELSQSRSATIVYEVSVQMVEIYNEQVRDLLVSNGSKRLGIWTTAQPNGLAVPEASMHHVASTDHVLELMEIGLLNRAVGATALNERSSRSHSVLTVHVRGTEAKSGSVLRGSLHLVDLAGSERVDRSEATGDRLREAQHINKSLSALGDVIFALAQKSPHVPYRNSKLTQVLQNSLGGQAKTLMFVQLNPDADSYSETFSTLKFAERVSGVELGAARVNKESREAKDLTEQVASLRDTVQRKEKEIERLRRKAAYNNCGSLSPRRRSTGSKKSDAESVESVGNPLQPSKSMVDLKKGYFHTVSKEDDDVLKFNEDSDERLSDISDGNLSMGADTESSFGGPLDLQFLPECPKPVEPSKQPNPTEEKEKSFFVSKVPKPSLKAAVARASRVSLIRNPHSRASTSTPTSAISRKSSTNASAAAYKTSKKWH